MRIEILLPILTFNNKAVKALRTKETTQNHLALLVVEIALPQEISYINTILLIILS